MKINVGIFLGGSSREREISFAGGRTVYNNLNRHLFNPVPIFVDSFHNWVLLDWPYLYQDSICDFFPPTNSFKPSENGFQIYLESIADLSSEGQQALLKQIGRPLCKSALHEHIDIAFISLHGRYAANGQLQQELEGLNIPYTGAGVKASQLGMDKIRQRQTMLEKGLACPEVEVFSKKQWLGADIHSLYQQIAEKTGFPVIIRPASQESGIGLSIIKKEAGLEGFERAVNRAFFRELISLDEWQDRSPYERVEFVKLLGDIRDGLGFPLTITLGAKEQTIYHPEELLSFLNTETDEAEHLSQVFVLEGRQPENDVILEGFVAGKTFSCMVIRMEDGSVIALPPVESNGGDKIFNKSFKTGFSYKERLIELPDEAIEAIRRACETLFSKLSLQVYARIDGVYTEEGTVSLNDLNTILPILPNAFFFQQAAETGLNPSQFLTYFIRISLQERLAEQTTQEGWRALLQKLDQQIQTLSRRQAEQKRIAVIMGGDAIGRRTSIESGRNIFEKLASSADYQPIPVYLKTADRDQSFFQLPIHLLLQNNVDSINAAIMDNKPQPLLEKIRRECSAITQKYASPDVIFKPQELSYDALADKVAGVFIALHGRPGEDGQLQMQLEAQNLPYNGSGIKSLSLTIDKYRTLQLLGRNRFPVADQLLLSKQDFNIDAPGFYQRVEQHLDYPFIGKPVDGSGHSAVKVIRDREALSAYTALTFGAKPEQKATYRRNLKLKNRDVFPQKGEILFEQMISQGDGIHLLEITATVLTHYTPEGRLRFEVFEPAEVLSSGKHTATRKGQYLIPARLSIKNYSHEYILEQVQHSLERSARLLSIEGYCTIDAFVRILPDGRAETQIIEVNTLPEMTPTAVIFKQAALAGFQPVDFIHKILSFSFARAQKKLHTKTIPLVTEAAKKTDEVQESQPKILFTDKNMDKPPMENTRITEATQASVSKLKRRMDAIKNLIISPYFLKNMGAMLVVIVIGFIGVNLFLNLYTGHGNSVQVENYTGLHIDDASKKASSRGFSIRVNEAPFSQDVMPGEVIDQEPEALSRIKKNRTIYLTIIGEPKPRAIPSFRDAADDYKQYAPKLKSLQINSVIKKEIFDARLAKGTILHFYYRGKKYTPNDVKRGVKVLQGSTLEFVITKNRDDNVRLPSLVCKRYSEVAFLLPSLALQVGRVEGSVANRADAFVWKQDPVYNPGAKILRGSTINLYLQNDRPQGCPAEVEINAPESDSGGIPESDHNLPTATEIDSTGGG